MHRHVIIPLSSRLGLLTFLAVAVVGLAISGLAPADRAAWWLEVLPVVVALPLTGWTHERFPLTWLAYLLITVWAVILVIGAHYTYAHAPLGHWLQDTFHLSRNNYDRIGHFAQGFVPAIVAREILLRDTPLRSGAWLSLIVVALCMALSVVYELVEWWVALLARMQAGAFLDNQGNLWDAQWNMLWITIGALTSLAVLSGAHDRALAALAAAQTPPGPA